ncbi:glycoside hydrolase family 2 TIM barrel-domain containing protein [Massilia niabensis]|uniref:Glycoside hydrolase family 2 TIM barrel-domain containing protein n=1 Tax=Massilia niabensis TaxID=544910 RepID=A0ABW0L4G6_9BURK
MIFQPFFHRVAVLLAAITLFGAGVHAAPAAAPAPVPSGRTETPLMQGWRFAFGDEHTEKSDGSNWQVVNLPHTWNRIGGHSTKAADANDKRGKGWYRLSFTAGAAAAKPRRSWLQFDGASIVSDVWLNGVHLGRHHGGVSGFRFDVTDALRTGDNLLVVRTDNTAPDTKGAATAETLPMGGDWFMYGGLYRKVSLITTAPVHIELGDHGGPGVYARTVSVEAGRARVEVTAKVRHNAGATQAVQVRTSLLDARGRAVASSTQPLDMAVSSLQEVKSSLEVAKPRLWNGVADPYLYTLRVDLLSGARTVDTVSQNFGIRTMRFDPDKGFFLNGKPLALRGVNRHQETGANGWAATDAELERDYAIIKEIGANTVRLAHYQHPKAGYDLADRMGLVVWAEVPLVLLSAPYGEPTATPGFIANAEQHLRELIRQNFNHPSIAVWSIANEPNLGNVWMRPKPLTVPLLKRLAALARAEDPSRAPVLASCCGNLPGSLMPTSKGPGLDSPPEAVDVYGVNVYFGWYYSTVSGLSAYLDEMHAFYPNKAMSVTEYGAGGALSQHTDNPLGGPIVAGGRPHPEGFQSYIHEHTWPQLRDKPYLWGSWLWNMFDFGTAIRMEGDLVDTNDKGIVSFDRKVKKESFYFYKAHWNPEPMIYLAGHRYTERASPVADVKAYTNAPKASLSVNGRDLGSVDCVERICLWRNVVLAKGDNDMLVSASVKGKTLRDRAVWRRADGPGTYRVLAGQLGVMQTSAGLYGSDNFFNGGEGQLLNPPARGTPPPPKVVAGAADQAMYLAYRTGRFSYALPLPNGEYNLTLRFVEPVESQTAGKRVFDVRVQGSVALADLDIAGQAGSMKALERTVPLRVNDGKAMIEFIPKTGVAILSSFSIDPR